MREFLKRSGRWLSVGWFWPLVLLALPNCGLYSSGIENENAFDGGDTPRTSAVMCDIPTVPPDGDFKCADGTDIGNGMADSKGAVALNLGAHNTILIDYSPAAYAQCGPQNPRRIDLHDEFPRGTAVCLNCDQQVGNGKKYTDPTAVCVAKCKELISAGGGPQPSDLDAFCQNAHVGTNFDKNVCINGVCTTGGMPLDPFPDPRVNPEKLTWIDPDPVNTTVNGNTLNFVGPGNAPDFTGGAASKELITTGDAWVEFEAGELLKTHVLGLRTSPCNDVAACPDQDYSLSDVSFGISLNVNNEVNVVDGAGNKLAGPLLPNYVLGERFRIHVVDRHDGKADLEFWRGSESGVAGVPCGETQMYTLALGTGPSYPLRVDATFREAPASLNNVKIMRIKKQP